MIEQIELQAKLLNYFLGSNKSNINHIYICIGAQIIRRWLRQPIFGLKGNRDLKVWAHYLLRIFCWHFNTNLRFVILQQRHILFAIWCDVDESTQYLLIVATEQQMWTVWR